MAKRILSGMTLAIACVFISLAGCTPKTELALKFAPEDTSSYTVTSQSVKNFKFEMPSSDKFKEDISTTLLAVTFEQKIESVDEAGVATANITIKGLKYSIVDKGEDKYKFDSDLPADQKTGLGKLLAASYKITIDPMGKVAVLDAASARNVVKGGVAATKAKGLLSDKAIISRHEVVTLGNLQQTTVSVGDTWSTVEAPSYKLLMPRTFEKIYKLEKVAGNVATVTMNAIPAGADKKGQINPAMMMFSSMLDAEEKFTGTMEYDLATGTLISQDETLKVKYIATDPKENAEPDVLIITLEYSQKAELVK